MKNKLTIFFAVIFLSIFVQCQKEDIRIYDYLVEIATVKIKESTITFLLDNGTILTPNSLLKQGLENGNRVILNYTPLHNGFININNVRRVFLDTVREEGYPNEVKFDPIKIISIWVSGKYLNISFEVDYHSKPHKAGLFKNNQASEPTYYFSYSREEDPSGAPTLNYLSFNLESLQKKNLIVYVNTYNEMRKIELKIN